MSSYLFHRLSSPTQVCIKKDELEIDLEIGGVFSIESQKNFLLYSKAYSEDFDGIVVYLPPSFFEKCFNRTDEYQVKYRTEKPITKGELNSIRTIIPNPYMALTETSDSLTPILRIQDSINHLLTIVTMTSMFILVLLIFKYCLDLYPIMEINAIFYQSKKENFFFVFKALSYIYLKTLIFFLVFFLTIKGIIYGMYRYNITVFIPLIIVFLVGTLVMILASSWCITEVSYHHGIVFLKKKCEGKSFLNEEELF